MTEEEITLASLQHEVMKLKEDVEQLAVTIGQLAGVMLGQQELHDIDGLLFEQIAASLDNLEEAVFPDGNKEA